MAQIQAPGVVDLTLFDCNSELERLGTFLGWPGPSSVSTLALARAGFSYLGSGDAVSCFACGLHVQGWERHHEPSVVHATQSPQCPMVLGGPSNNRPVHLPPEKEYIKVKAMLTELGLRAVEGPSRHFQQSDGAHSSSCRLADTLALMYGDSMLSTASQDTSHQQQASSNPSSASSEHLSRASYSPGHTRRSPSYDKNRRANRAGSATSRRGTGSETPSSTPPPRRCSSTSDADVSVAAAATSMSASNSSSPRPAYNRAQSHNPKHSARGSETLANRQASASSVDHRRYRHSEEDRLQTFQAWGGMRGVSAAEFAEAGFIFIGPPDRVQCVVCQGILKNWNDNDQPIQEHRKHFPDCGFVKEYFSRPSSRSGPRHPKFKTEAARMASFTRWVQSRNPTPAELAQAGFFYAGHGDSVKCFHCDGGLRNWEPNDDPWREHARWFPKCGFVKDVKGKAFVSEVLTSCTEFYQSASVDDTERKNVAQAPTASAATTAQRSVDPREVTARMDSPIVKAVLKMDVPRKLVKLAIKKRLSENGADFSSAEALLEAVFSLDFPDATNETESEETSELGDAASVGQGDMPSSGSSNSNNSENLADSMRLMEENRQLKEQRQCKICMDEEVCMAFLPCGHLVCCANCAPALDTCPICRAKIRGTVRTYMS